MPISPQAKSRYLKDPYHCPFCGSDCIEGERPDIENDQAVQDVMCTKCGERWTDIYALIDVVTDDEIIPDTEVQNSGTSE